MRTTTALLVIVVVIMAVFAIANLDRLLYPMTISLLVGNYTVPALLTFILAILGAAAAFALITTLVSARASSRQAAYLKRIDELRQSLDKGESARFDTLTRVLEEHVARLEARIEAMTANVNTRIDRVRDELAADIAQAEHTIITGGDIPPNRR
ncbi:MAG TPA: LapA family protein [Deinococcales bacterium]|nr:LapA family protein [Deinococcales bacterium]